MSRRSDGSYLKRVLVIDLEATCFSGRPPEGQRSEIIEIGNAVLYTEDLRIEAGPEILVRPTVSAVSAFCTELTSLTQEDVDRRGVSLEEGLARLAAAHGDLQSTIWASFGEYDRTKLGEECRVHGLDFPLSRTHINIKRLAALAVGWPREEGMAGTLGRLGLEPLPGSVHHRGADDACNIATILGHLFGLLRKGLSQA